MSSIITTLKSITLLVSLFFEQKKIISLNCIPLTEFLTAEIDENEQNESMHAIVTLFRFITLGF
jgi:hypothetical protein